MRPIASSIVVLAGSWLLGIGSILATAARETGSGFGWADIGAGGCITLVGLVFLSTDRKHPRT